MKEGGRKARKGDGREVRTSGGQSNVIAGFEDGRRSSDKTELL